MRMYTTRRCPTCDGSGEVDCSACGGSGYNWAGGQCSYCGGLGWQTCPDCNGEGHVEEDQGEHTTW